MTTELEDLRKRLEKPARGDGKCCLECGTALVQARTMKPGRFAAVKFCSLQCSRAAQAKAFAAKRPDCEVCGVSVKARFRFCSRACASKHIVEQRPMCEVCGIRKRHRDRLTCGLKCGQALRKNRTRKEAKCPQCEGTFWPRRSASGKWSKVCSLACERRRLSSAHPPFIGACLSCGATVRRFRSSRQWARRGGRCFCSPACRIGFMRGENSTSYRGNSDPNRGPGWKRLAAQIRDRDSHQCRRCGAAHPGSGRAFHVDHVVPWRAFDDKKQANDPSNLVTLCPRCHQLKTVVIEHAWLKGDVIAFEQYRLAIGSVQKAASE